MPADRTEPLRIGKPVYGGDGLAHTGAGEVVFVPFALPGELVRLQGSGGRSGVAAVEVLAAAPERVHPECLHFGVCGGCQYQMAQYPAQIRIKAAVLAETLARAAVPGPESEAWPSPEAYGYRNRIRLRVGSVEGVPRLGYSVRHSHHFLPVTMCPIAAPLLWRAAEALMNAAREGREPAAWLQAVAEVELFCSADERRLQINLLCLSPPPGGTESFARAMEAVRSSCPELTGAGAARLDARSGRALESLAAWGAAGLPYQIGAETYWVSRGSFFQVNRFLLPRLVDLVCAGRSGSVAWDLFAGIGLFSRVLANRFTAVTAVEANPLAAAELGRVLAKLGPQHRAVQSIALEFLRRAVLERERPELIVLDPPRAGAGEETCRLLTRLAPREIVYLSCDPTTLARDLRVLTSAGYRIAALHGIDLFPQTYHLETMAVLRHP